MKALKQYFRNPMGVIGLAMLLVVVLVAVFAPWLAPYNPRERVEVLRRWRALVLGAVRLGSRAQGRDESAAELTPVGEHRRHDLRHLGCPQPEQPMSRSALECPPDALAKRVLQYRSVFGFDKQEAAARRQRGSQSKLGVSGGHLLRGRGWRAETRPHSTRYVGGIDKKPWGPPTRAARSSGWLPTTASALPRSPWLASPRRRARSFGLRAGGRSPAALPGTHSSV